MKDLTGIDNEVTPDMVRLARWTRKRWLSMGLRPANEEHIAATFALPHFREGALKKIEELKKAKKSS